MTLNDARKINQSAGRVFSHVDSPPLPPPPKKKKKNRNGRRSSKVLSTHSHRIKFELKQRFKNCHHHVEEN